MMPLCLKFSSILYIRSTRIDFKTLASKEYSRHYASIVSFVRALQWGNHQNIKSISVAIKGWKTRPKTRGLDSAIGFFRGFVDKNSVHLPFVCILNVLHILSMY